MQKHRTLVNYEGPAVTMTTGQRAPKSFTNFFFIKAKNLQVTKYGM